MANPKKIQANEIETEILYQKLGDRWFAFSIVNDEVFMSPVSDDQVRAAKAESIRGSDAVDTLTWDDTAESRQVSDPSSRGTRNRA